MEIEDLNEGSGSVFYPCNKWKELSLTSEAEHQPKKKAQLDLQLVVAQMPQVKDGQPGDKDEGCQTVGKKGSTRGRK